MSSSRSLGTRHPGNMLPPPPEIRSKAEREDAACSQLVTRIVGGISLVMGMLLLAVGTILLSQPCCGDHFSYDEEEWNKECGVGGEDTIFASDSKSTCYHRNIGVLICYLFAILGFGIGATIIILGECMYNVNDEAEEEKLEQYIKYMRSREIEMIQEEKYRKKLEKQARSETRTEMSDRERTERLDIGRRYNETPSDRQLNAMYGTRQPQVVQSNPYVYGQARPYAV